MSTQPVATREQSLTNLCIAFNGESNAAVRYAAFAKKADEEGYLRVGSLLRAVARSEQIPAQDGPLAPSHDRDAKGEDHDREPEYGRGWRVL